MNRSSFGLLLALFACFAACADPDPRTQITFALEAPAELIARVASLSVVVTSETGEDMERYQRSELEFPVEIVVIPRGANRTTREVRLVAVASDDAQREIARWERSERFLARENLSRRVAAMLLTPSAGPPDAGDPGDTDAGLDATTPDGGRDAEATSDEAATPDAQPRADASSGTESCATAGTTIRCDDGNRCNGMETCEPQSASADLRGCVPGTPLVCTGEATTCDSESGMCTTCGDRPDGDGDGARSISCNGADCDDRDDSVAPGKPERCDRKDNDCNGTIDDAPAASADCMAPRDGSASCVEGRCTQRCNDPNHQIENGACVPPVGTCPIVNPCAPGRCIPGRGGYTCECPTGYRAGLARCAPSGVKARAIGFESGCDGMATPGAFVMGSKQVPSNLYATCGVAALSSSGLTGVAQLFEPGTTMIEGMTGTVVLAGTSGMAGAPSEISITFSPGVHELSFDALDIDAAAGLRVRLETADGTALLDAAQLPATGSKRVRVMHMAATPVARAVLSYTQVAADDVWYLDQLAFNVWGCGDAEVEMAAGEACDDGNAVQCDGCDNACVASPMMCTEPGPSPLVPLLPRSSP